MSEYNLFEIPKISKTFISSELPEEIIKQREGGGKKLLSYISGATVTDLLNKAFNYNWNWEVKQFFVQESVPYMDKRNNKKLEQNPVAHVLGTLTVKFKDSNEKVITISKDGFGSKSILGRQADQESIFKAADTDALKKAASRLGIGLDLYRDEEEQEFFNIINDDEEEDAWDDDSLNQFSEQLNFISSVREEINDDEQFNELITSFSEDLHDISDITPSNVQGFYDFIKSLQESAEE